MSGSHRMLCCQVFILVLFAHTIRAEFHASGASAAVSFDGPSPVPPLGALAPTPRPNRRRMYAMCPPQFQRVGTDCYSLVSQRSSWLEAHFFCKDKNANLAEPLKYADRKLRAFLQKEDAHTGDHEPVWIGATFDHRNHLWQWSMSGRNLTYDSFSEMDPTEPNDNNCAVYDPSLKYRWSARSCPDKLRFICQHKMPKVSEANRYKIYNRWNATYPNERANEVVLEIIDRNDKDRRYGHAFIASP
ncbi:blast:Lithostathine-1-beta [Drosophila guanche]|uniref:Blast:Lithostathine-1-beta n=1 Tax=Drosophila guanche TaxID=7266 RepID=A0A3B0KB00_DROGU|nr:blast:Lithostathine-1-beta [Drosophila guanche]